MKTNDIQMIRYEKNIPLALLAETVGLSVMELWKIETMPDCSVEGETLTKIFSALLSLEPSCPAKDV